MISVHIIKKHYECVIAIKYIYTIEPVISCHRSTKKRRCLVRKECSIFANRKKDLQMTS